MSRTVAVLIALVCLHHATARPVRKTLNFNMFVLKPHQGADRTVLTTDGLSRFGPVLEYLVQRVQGMMSVKLPPEVLNESDPSVPIADATENEVDGHQHPAVPGVVVRPSLTKPGTYEVEIDVVVDDEQSNATPK